MSLGDMELLSNKSDNDKEADLKPVEEPMDDEWTGFKFKFLDDHIASGTHKAADEDE
jgi:hypothetical protein